MSVTRIATRYAKSLLELAQEENKLEEVLKDIKAFKEALKSRDLFLLIKSPIVNETKKEQIFKILFEKSYDKLTNSFFRIILKKGREAVLPEIASHFIEQYKELKGISTVFLISAKVLSKKELDSIKEKLIENKLVSGSVEFHTSIDPEIIGGFIVKIGDKLYDASVKRRLNDLKKEFSENKFVKAF